MIAIDTNVLLRYLLWDDEKQSAKAEALITDSSFVLVSDVVLVETLWILQGRKYRISKEETLAVINALFEEPNIIFEDGQTIWRALNDYRQADFSDTLIINKAKYIAEQNQVDLEAIYTFDTAAQEIEGVKAP
ncbi:MAG: PIN domain nuclease [uncultured Thiotrichaceae bacterium]|uniref:PIN domain nuclease n=1 Tax=uncultured Thiotrichaceae bacterium TaxID=298394 RepID=A0A6S6TZ32_9GAMM|nr:MAG: PIN domain nuclease [uncultured Thiotrichaceae bacterium]